MTSSFYLYNNYSTSYLSIDPATSGFGLRALTGTSDVSLPFTISPIANSNFVKICTSVASNPYCLDIYGDKKTVPHLSTPGNYMGQQWSLISSKTAGLFKLSNAYTGTGWYLDVYADGVNGAFMSENDYTGQYWKQVQANTAAVPSSPARQSISTVLVTQLFLPSQTQIVDNNPTLPSTNSATPPVIFSEFTPPAATPSTNTAAKARIEASYVFFVVALSALF